MENELYIYQASNKTGSKEKVLFSFCSIDSGQIDLPNDLTLDQIIIVEKTSLTGDFSLLPLDVWLSKENF